MASAAVSAPSGTVPLRLDIDLFAESGGASSSQNELSALRCEMLCTNLWLHKLTSVLDAFKPGSVADVPGYLTNHASGSKEMTFDIVVSLEALFADWKRADWTRMVVSKCLTFARRLASRVNAS